jgi:hypothetical protein
MKYFFYGFAAVAFVCLLMAAIPFALGMMLFGAGSSAHTLTVLQEVPSPDARYVATSYSDMGGGALGWCIAELNIRPVGSELPPNETVFATHCGTKVNLSWGSSTDLSVEFSPEGTDFGVTHSSTSKDGQIRIHYVEKPPQPKPPPSANLASVANARK